MPPTNPDIENLSETAYQAYINWRQNFLSQIGKEICCKFPNFYGNIQFNIQNGICVNINVNDGIRLKHGNGKGGS